MGCCISWWDSGPLGLCLSCSKRLLWTELTVEQVLAKPQPHLSSSDSSRRCSHSSCLLQLPPALLCTLFMLPLTSPALHSSLCSKSRETLQLQAWAAACASDGFQLRKCLGCFSAASPRASQQPAPAVRGGRSAPFLRQTSKPQPQMAAYSHGLLCPTETHSHIHVQPEGRHQGLSVRLGDQTDPFQIWTRDAEQLKTATKSYLKPKLRWKPSRGSSPQHSSLLASSAQDL